jgi:hypothetical protein
MRSRYGETADAAGSHNHKPDQTAGESGASGGRDAAAAPAPAHRVARTRAESPPQTAGSTGASGRSAADTVTSTPVPADASVARRTAQGWRIGDEEVPDLTSAMVLADLLAAELTADSTPSVPEQPAATPSSGHANPRQAPGDTAADSRKLEQTVAQLEHALTARVRVEQAIGVLAERHRLRPRQAFDLLRSAARARGKRVMEMASEVVDSATNPLLRIPEELAKPPVTRRGGRIHRRTLESG